VTANDGLNISSELITVAVTNVAGVTINGTSGNDVIDATHTVAGQSLPTNEETSSTAALDGIPSADSAATTF